MQTIRNLLLFSIVFSVTGCLSSIPGVDIPPTTPVWKTQSIEMRTIEDLNNTTYLVKIFDPLGNAYVLYNRHHIEAPTDLYLVKINTAGKRDWLLNIPIDVNAAYPQMRLQSAEIFFDSTNTLFISGVATERQLSGSTVGMFATKIDSSGQIVWRDLLPMETIETSHLAHSRISAIMSLDRLKVAYYDSNQVIIVEYNDLGVRNQLYNETFTAPVSGRLQLTTDANHQIYLYQLLYTQLSGTPSITADKILQLSSDGQWLQTLNQPGPVQNFHVNSDQTIYLYTGDRVKKVDFSGQLLWESSNPFVPQQDCQQGFGLNTVLFHSDQTLYMVYQPECRELLGYNIVKLSATGQELTRIARSFPASSVKTLVSGWVYYGTGYGPTSFQLDDDSIYSIENLRDITIYGDDRPYDDAITGIPIIARYGTLISQYDTVGNLVNKVYTQGTGISPLHRASDGSITTFIHPTPTTILNIPILSINVAKF